MDETVTEPSETEIPLTDETVTEPPKTEEQLTNETVEPAETQTQPANSAVTITPKTETQPTDTAVRSPKTGDTADAALWIALTGVSGVLLLTALSVNTAKKKIK